MKGFILTYKDGRKRGYTTLSAIFEDNAKEELGVSKYTLDRFNFSIGEYENEKCMIEALEFKTKGDVIREREQTYTMNKEKSIEIGHFLGESARNLSFIKTEAAYIKDFAGHFSRYTNNIEGVAKSIAVLCEKEAKHRQISERRREMISEMISTVANMKANEYSRTDCSFGFFEKFNVV